MTHPFGYIGIDFGTSNSHFAYCNDSGTLIAEPVGGVGDKGSMPTCVLWQKPAEEAKKEEDIHSYGQDAQHAWIAMTSEERSGMHFAFGFKPDLVHLDRAQLDAWAFLRQAFMDVSQAGLPHPIGPEGYSVAIGVPVKIGERHCQLTEEIAAKAGFGSVKCVAEPLGALAFHLNKDLSPAEAREGAMVIDFGGGTFDVAVVNTKEGIQQSWGDPMLGGRLFDDLFLQWLLEQNPKLEVSESEALEVWQNQCRQLKEHFSKHWSKVLLYKKPWGKFGAIPIKIGGRDVFLKNATETEFEQRARAYRPSNVVCKYLRGLDNRSCGLVLNQPINLFDWIRQTLSRGRPVGQPQGKFSVVILTGGSCNWPFIRPMVEEVLGHKKIMMSQNPEETIGNGLARYHVLKRRYDDRRRQIESHKPKARTDFEKAVLARLDRYVDELSETLLNSLMPRAEKVYWDWYNNGGSLNQVEIRVKEICKKFEETEAAGIAKRYWAPLNTDLLRLMRDHLAKFLQENEITQSASNYLPESVASFESLQSGAGGIVTDVGDMASIVTVITAIALLVLAAVKVKVIGAVVVAAMAHPPLAVALGLVALIAAWRAGESVKELLEEKIKSHEFNSVTRRLLYLALWESTFRNKLAEGRGEAKLKLQDAIGKSTSEIDETAAAKLPPGLRPEKPIKQQALAAFDNIIDVMIQDLGVLG